MRLVASTTIPPTINANPEPSDGLLAPDVSGGWCAGFTDRPAGSQRARAAAQLRLRWPSVSGISLGMVFQSMCLYGFNAWAPSIFQRMYGWPAPKWTPGTTSL